MRVLVRPPLLLRSAKNGSTAAATSASSQETLRVATMTADAPSASRAGVGAGAGAEDVMQEGGWGEINHACSVEEQICVVWPGPQPQSTSRILKRYPGLYKPPCSGFFGVQKHGFR